MELEGTIEKYGKEIKITWPTPVTVCPSATTCYGFLTLENKTLSEDFVAMYNQLKFNGHSIRMKVREERGVGRERLKSEIKSHIKDMTTIEEKMEELSETMGKWEADSNK